jgi:outer membrane protein assembly factor BamB
VIYGLGFGDTLYANDAAGAGCSGAPPTCPPLWSATLNDPASPVAVANGVVYLQTEHVADGGLVNGTVLAFDAAGVTRCAGTPRSCTSLWSAPTGADAVFSRAAPVVANGIVYAGSHQGLYAFALP